MRILYPFPPSQHPSLIRPTVLALHGGAFVLGHAGMNSLEQIEDCLSRGWIVLALEYRLCPQVDILSGPMTDCRDALSWVQSGGLDHILTAKAETAMYMADVDRVVAFGTSSGGHLSLSLGFDVPRPVLAILDFYGPVHFADPFWTSRIEEIASKLPTGLTPEFLNQVYDEKPVPTKGGVSLEGQAKPGPPDFSDPRQAYAFTNIANGTLMKSIFPSQEWKKIDPIENVTEDFPPTFIVHGLADSMVPISLSREMYGKLKEKGVECEMVEIPGEPHTFVARMEKGGATWELQRKGFDWLQGIIERKQT